MKRLLRYVILLILASSSVGIAQDDQSDKDRNNSNNPFSQSKYAPDISFILDAAYLHRNIKDEKFHSYSMPGFFSGTRDEVEIDEMNSRNGFNLNYGEIGLMSTVDPYFDLTGIFHIRPDGFEMEEGYFITRSLPLGLQIIGGKFLSGFGRVNGQHAHYWNFAEMPLVYKTFFGSEGLNEIGMQINWISPTDLYLMFGAEIFQGENNNSFGVRGFNDPYNVSNISNSNRPDLFTGFARTSFDVGDIICLAGVSGAFGKYRSNNGIEEDKINGSAMYGDSKLFGANLNLKYLLTSDRDITLQTEYVNRKMQGDFYYWENDSTVLKNSYDKKQTGLYAQVVFKYSKNWKIGVRYDDLIQNDISYSSAKQEYPKSFPIITGMLEYNPTEFSRLRLEYVYDRSKYAEIEEGYLQKSTSTILFELNLVIGAHGAHPF